jgi:DNA-binding IclR family transcriptional regulator
MNTKSPTAEVVLAALSANPESTTTELALAAALGRSTVGKALTALESEGRVARTPGGRDGRRRVPDRWAVARPDTKPRPSAAKASEQRLAKGELRALVLGYLRAHGGEELSPTTVAGALGRSAGAVGNAMAALAEAGSLSQVSAVPRRFAHPG